MAQPSKKHKAETPFTVGDLRGGVNMQAVPEVLGENEATILENFEFEPEGGKLVTRGGTSAPIYTFSSNIKRAYYDYEMNIYFVFLENRDIYKYILGQAPLLLGVTLGSLRPSCCKFGGALLIASGNKLQKYDYASLTTLTNSPMCDTVFERFGRVGVTKTGTDDIIYSSIGDASVWMDDPNDDSDGWETPIGYMDGGDILGCYSLATDIIVFKSNGKIFQLAGEPPEQQVYEIAKDSDFVYNFGIVGLGQELIYMSKRGLRSLSTSKNYGNFSDVEFGAKINSAASSSVFHPLLWNLPRKKQLILRPNEGTQFFVYHYQLNCFTTMTFPQIVVDICESPTELIVAMGASLHYWSQSYGTDNGAEITAKLKSRSIKSIQDILVKRLVALVAPSASGSGTFKIAGVSLHFDFSPTMPYCDIKQDIESKVIDVEFTTTSKLSFSLINMTTVLL